MHRVAIVVALLLGLLVGGGAIYATRPTTPVLGNADVRAIVAEMLAEHDAAKPPIEAASLDAATLNPMIENYLLGDPRILERVSAALETEVRTAEAAEAKAAIASLRTAIYEDPDNIVLGNPNGDVTLVEMFDYNCSYCRGAVPDLATLIAEDPNLRVILKEFPILSKESVDAARVGVLVAKAGADYWSYHQGLFSTRGQINADTALEQAKTLGLNPIALRLDMESEAVTAIIQKSYDLAKALNVNGTPTYIIGDELIPGAVGIDELRTRIANMRSCGSTQCPAPAGGDAG